MRLIGQGTLTGRLTLLFAGASSAVLLGLGLVIGSSVEQHFEEQDMEVLSGKLELARHALEKVRNEQDLDHLPQQLDDSLVGHHSLAVAVLTPRQEVIFATSGASFPQTLIGAGRPEDPRRPLVWMQGGTSYRGISATLPTGIEAWPPVVVAIATDISHHQAFMASFRKTLWLFVAGAALLTGLLAWGAARRGLAPLHKMRETASAVTAQQLGHRLPVAEIPGELAALAESLNDMLARLEEAFRRLSDFSSDLAHELRTPVSNLLTQTQVALSRARSADDYRAVLESNGEEFERLARMISGMLFLAKAENGFVVPTRESVDLAVEVRELFDFYDALAEEKQLSLTFTGSGQVVGDRLMLRRALSNLLSNAVRHSPAEGSIRVTVDDGAAATVICVENTGDTISPEHLERLFDRFYRVDPARHRGSEGAGLGLAITKSIIGAHGGTISVASSGGVTRFEVTLPHSPVVARSNALYLEAQS